MRLEGTLNVNKGKSGFCFSTFGPHLEVLQAYSTHLALSGGHYRMLGIESRLAVCNAIALPAVLLLWPNKSELNTKVDKQFQNVLSSGEPQHGQHPQKIH